MLRINPDNTCEIQILNCSSGLWDTWINVNDCATGAVGRLGGIGQQTDHTPIAPAECRTYDIVIPANQQYLLPVLLSAGDTITVTDTGGSANDGVLILGLGTWNIPNGGVYRGPLGDEPDNTSLNEADPKPDSPHMCLIMNIEGTWYDAFNATDFAVPAGAISENLVFQVNDSNLGDNSGSYKFQVAICKGSVTAPETGDWIRVYDFSTGNKWGWGTDTNTATWTGSGWLFNALDDVVDAPSLVDMDTVVTRMDTFWYDAHLENTVFFYTGDTIITAPQATETDLIPETGVDSNRIAILTEWGSNHYDSTLRKVIVYGHNTPMPNGVNPF